MASEMRAIWRIIGEEKGCGRDFHLLSVEVCGACMIRCFALVGTFGMFGTMEGRNDTQNTLRITTIILLISLTTMELILRASPFIPFI